MMSCANDPNQSMTQNQNDHGIVLCAAIATFDGPVVSQSKPVFSFSLHLGSLNTKLCSNTLDLYLAFLFGSIYNDEHQD